MVPVLGIILGCLAVLGHIGVGGGKVICHSDRKSIRRKMK